MDDMSRPRTGPERGGTLLDREISYHELVDAGALGLYSEAVVRRWYGGGETRTVGELLTVGTHPSRVIWAVMRERVLPAWVLHQLAVDYTEEFLERGRRRSVYLDYRTERGLVAEQDWLDQRISLGEVRVARRWARQARTDVAGLGDHAASAVADIVCAAMQDNGEAAYRAVFYLFLETYSADPDLRWLIRQARALLGAVKTDEVSR
jgi:hypothetical protein